MLGAIIGDIVGSIYEFSNIKTKEFLFFSEEKEYTGSYENIKKGDELHFYVSFTNNVDYVKTIDSFKTTVEA